MPYVRGRPLPGAPHAGRSRLRVPSQLRPGRRPGLRWALAAALLGAEALWLTRAYQAPEAPEASAAGPGWGLLLGLFNGGHHYTALVLCGAGLALALAAAAPAIRDTLRDQAGYRWWPWLALHGLCLPVFALATAAGFGSDGRAPALSAGWLALWSASGAALLATWLLTLAPAPAWGRVLVRHGRALALGLAAGAGVWLTGLLAQGLWGPLAEGTLRLSALLLHLWYPEVVYDPQGRILGTPVFTVEIDAPCSGYEGIALTAGFVALYLWTFRRDLAFPRALLLFPVGLAAIWLANGVRVAALVAVGTGLSPEMAARGFHSQGGWIGFTLVALGLIAVSHRWLAAPRQAVPAPTGGAAGAPGESAPAGSSRPAAAPAAPPSSSGSALPLLAPLLTLLAVSMGAAAFSAGLDALYPLGALAAGAVLWRFRHAYRPLFGPWSWEPVWIGVLVLCIWALLVPGASPDGLAPMAERLERWPAWLLAAWVLLRVLGSVVVVPFAEELAFRGYLIRKLVARDFERVPPGRFGWLSFLVSSGLFGLLHQHVLAGALAGAAFALALYRRGRVGDAILAHMSANGLIAVAVLATGQWGWWG